jgi:hypothetical protein
MWTALNPVQILASKRCPERLCHGHLTMKTWWRMRVGRCGLSCKTLGYVSLFCFFMDLFPSFVFSWTDFEYRLCLCFRFLFSVGAHALRLTYDWRVVGCLVSWRRWTLVNLFSDPSAGDGLSLSCVIIMWQCCEWSGGHHQASSPCWPFPCIPPPTHSQQ